MAFGKDETRKKIRRDRLALAGIALVLFIAGIAVGTLFLANIYNDWRAGTDETPVGAGATIAVGQKTAVQLIDMIEKNPNDLSALFEMGNRFYRAGFWQDAISVLTRMVEADPGITDANNFSAWVGIGNSSFNLKKYPEAKKAWDEALKQRPDDAQLHFNLGVYYATIIPPEKDAARAEWKKVIALVPGTELAATSSRYIDAYAVPQEKPVSPAVPGTISP